MNFAKFIPLLFILTLSFFVQIHARESQFFSKVTNVNNNPQETTTVVPNKEEALTKHEQQPVFIPQTQNGYGLYGHESGQFPPITATHPTTSTNNNAPFKTVFEDDESLRARLSRKTLSLGRRSMPDPFSYLPPSRSSLNGEDKFLLQLEIAAQIVYLLILIVVLMFALRKCKHNGGRGQTAVRVNGAAEDDAGDTSSGQIAMGPTSIAVDATMAF